MSLKFFLVQPQGNWHGHTKEYMTAAEDKYQAAKDCYDKLRPAEGKRWRNGGPPTEFRVYTMMTPEEMREDVGVLKFEDDPHEDLEDNNQAFAELWHKMEIVRL